MQARVYALWSLHQRVNWPTKYITSASSSLKVGNGGLSCSARPLRAHFLTSQCVIKLVRGFCCPLGRVLISWPRYHYQHSSTADSCSSRRSPGTRQVHFSPILRNILDAHPLHSVRHLVLDEADRLLDTEFLEQIQEINAACTHPNLQRAMFSATLPAGVEKIAMSMLQDPIRLVVGLR